MRQHVHFFKCLRKTGVSFVYYEFNSNICFQREDVQRKMQVKICKGLSFFVKRVTFFGENIGKKTTIAAVNTLHCTFLKNLKHIQTSPVLTHLDPKSLGCTILNNCSSINFLSFFNYKSGFSSDTVHNWLSLLLIGCAWQPAVGKVLNIIGPMVSTNTFVSGRCIWEDAGYFWNPLDSVKSMELSMVSFGPLFSPKVEQDDH